MRAFQLLSVGNRTSLRIYHSSSSASRAFSWLSTKNFSDSAMEKNPSQDHGKLTQDEKKEEVCKGACDSYYPSKPGTADRLLPHLLNLYASRAEPNDFEIYAPDATFEDPLMCAEGVNQIKSAFYSIPKVFSESKIVDYTVTENMISPTKLEILIDNKQYYKFMGRNIDMISLIKLYVEGGKVVRHEDWWDKKPLLNKDTVNVPLVGRVIEASRRGSMFATHLLMRFGKDPTP